jgi:hypothetical protein
MSKQGTGQAVRQAKQGRRRDRREEQRRREEERLRAAKRQRSVLGGIVAAIVLVTVGIFFIYRSVNSDGQASANGLYPGVDNVTCDQGEQTAYHIHAHLSIYINGAAVQVPQGIGIAPDGSCFYWLHTHDTSGIIHIEAPGQQHFTLGNFFDVWSQRFSQLPYPLQLDNTSAWQVYVDGKPYTGNFRQIPLQAHELVTLAYNSPHVTPDTIYNWGDL